MVKLTRSARRARRTRALPGARESVLALTLLAVVIGGFLVGRSALRLTTNGGDGGGFDRARAMADLEIIAAEPRPIGSAAWERVRNYLLSELTAMGLEPQVQATTVIGPGEPPGSVYVTRVANVLARIPATAPGAGPGRAVLLAAHYDSVGPSPGAADLGLGVATMLEAARVLSAERGLRNDVIVLFADGEEKHLQGAQAFVEQHPWAADVAVAFNLESIGSTGAVLPYFGRSDNGWAMRRYLDSVRAPTVNSAFSGLLTATGESADLRHYLDVAADGLEFVNVDGVAVYHAPIATPERMDPDTLARFGEVVVPLARAAANADLDDVDASPVVAYTVAGGLVLTYPQALVAPVAVLATVAVAAAVWFADRRRLLGWTAAVRAAGRWIAAVVAGLVVASLAWAAVRALDPRFDVHLHGGVYRRTPYLVAMAAIAVAVTALLAGRTGQRRGPVAAFAGAALTLAVLSALFAFVLPGWSALLAWPAIAAAAGLAVLPTLVRPDRATGSETTVRNSAALAAVAPAAMVAVALAAPLVGLLFQLQARLEFIGGLPFVAAPLLPLTLAATLALGALTATAATTLRPLAAAAAVIAVIALVFGAAVNGFGPDQPRPDHVAYVLDADRGEARWVQAGPADAYTRRFVTDGEPVTYTPYPTEFPAWHPPATAAPAPALDLAAPQATGITTTDNGARRTATLSSPRRALQLQAVLRAPGPIEQFTVDGAPIAGATANERATVTVQLINPNPAGTTITLTAPPGPLDIELTDWTNGLPTIPNGPDWQRPSDTMAAPYEFADPTIVRRRLTVN